MLLAHRRSCCEPQGDTPFRTWLQASARIGEMLSKESVSSIMNRYYPWQTGDMVSIPAAGSDPHRRGHLHGQPSGRWTLDVRRWTWTISSSPFPGSLFLGEQARGPGYHERRNGRVFDDVRIT